MNDKISIPTTRIEAFSDGVIAIIITIMVFDLKFQEIPAGSTVINQLWSLLPKFLSYIVSFLMISIMWVNHHQIFHQLKTTDRHLPWININLLFWMSLIPFGTNFVGENPEINIAAAMYGTIFFMCALSFTILRDYIPKHKLLYDSIKTESYKSIRIKNRIAMATYFLAAAGGLLSVYLTYLLILLVPAMYFIPEKISHK